MRMKRENTLFVVTLIILALMIAATVICAIKYMHEEPIWNREPVSAVTGAPEADEPEGSTPLREIVTENMPPGRG